MATNETACGINAYSKESGLSGAAMWQNYAKSLNSRATGILGPIFEMKGQASYKAEK